MKNLIIQWLYKGLELESGEELYIPVDNKVAQSEMYNALRKELGVLRQIDAEKAAKLRISSTWKDNAFWVVLKKISVTPLVAFKKDADGTVSRVTIVNDKDNQRIQRLKEASNA